MCDKVDEEMRSMIAFQLSELQSTKTAINQNHNRTTIKISSLALRRWKWLVLTWSVSDFSACAAEQLFDSDDFNSVEPIVRTIADCQ